MATCHLTLASREHPGVLGVITPALGRAWGGDAGLTPGQGGGAALPSDARISGGGVGADRE